MSESRVHTFELQGKQEHSLRNWHLLASEGMEHWNTSGPEEGVDERNTRSLTPKHLQQPARPLTLRKKGNLAALRRPRRRKKLTST
ncbi:rCG20116, isoform CRA_b [Rattus norvegicus]|uniref:RCG20116, isoform CRA_b n=2 Tax=Rattus norvegicus TaxID=10116 RepID=A6JFU7_RAT|nr:Purkinje cell protein 4-like protein 1 isoform X1 [Rattus norvegicus]EDL94603.1 rCG20116, isoform CRA_b [Rattus norvegicus]|eukprot:XP_017454425.1 PREDICTED: Purkinje cell protein 4-like protein 1 isoform X1 [Rattus norvegicus]